MNEKVNTALLLVVIALLVFLVVQSQGNGQGRFLPLEGVASYYALDTQTGKACGTGLSVRLPSGLYWCKDLATQ